VFYVPNNMERMNKLNHHYFDEINTEYKAYILGFIYADGCIVDNINGRQKSLRIAIQWEDGYILQQLLDDIYYKEKSLRYRYPPAAQKANEKPQAAISINSDILCESLINVGCFIRKSSVGMIFPNLKEELVPHFIRGFFDGDGSIVVNEVKNRYIRVKDYLLKKEFKPKLRKRIFFTSTDKTFLQTILNKLPNILGKPQWRSVIKKNTTWTLSLEVQKDVSTIYNYLYKDASVFLKRKKDKFTMSISSQANNKLLEGSETT
jgi:hypothetical protein